MIQSTYVTGLDIRDEHKINYVQAIADRSEKKVLIFVGQHNNDAVNETTLVLTPREARALAKILVEQASGLR